MNREDAVKNFEKIWASLKAESERGSFIVSAAICDDVLMELISRKVRTIDHDKNKHLFKGGNALIKGFSERIDMAFLLGCLSKRMHESLHILRGLRNDFAHLSSPISINDQSVKDRVKNLLTLNKDFVIVFWGDVRNELFASMNLIDAPPDVKDGDFLEDILYYAGYRHAYEIWASSFIAFLNEDANTVKRIEKYERNAD